MILKGNSHCHSTHSDGSETIEKMVKAYQMLDYDFLFLTDHNSDYEYKVEQKGDLIVFYGNELSNDPQVNQHVNEVRTKNQKLRILNHPSRYRNTLNEIDEFSKKYDIDAVEVTEHGRLYSKYLKADIPQIASDDAHNFRMVSDSYILVETDDKDADEILKSIKKGRINLAGIQFSSRFIKSKFEKASGI